METFLFLNPKKMAEETVSQETVKYEMMGILLPDLGEDGTNSELNELKELIASHGGSVSTEDLWGVKDLAYRIKKQDQGFYFVWNIDLPASSISELEKDLNIHQALLRYLFIRLPENYELRSLAEYEEIAAEEKKALEEAQEKEAAAAKKAVAARKAKKVAEKKAEEAKEAADEAKTADSGKTEEADEKLKSIVSDPDISL